METQKDTAAFMATFCRLLQAGETLSLPVLGSSMAPFLVHRRDTVWLSAPTRPLKAGDIVLYRRRNGEYILHRVRSVKGGVYTMIGDAHTVSEPGIAPAQILGIVTHALRKGKTQQPGTFWWEFFARFWVRVIPLRPIFLRVYTAAGKLFRRSL